MLGSVYDLIQTLIRLFLVLVLIVYLCAFVFCFICSLSNTRRRTDGRGFHRSTPERRRRLRPGCTGRWQGRSSCCHRCFGILFAVPSFHFTWPSFFNQSRVSTTLSCKSRFMRRLYQLCMTDGKAARRSGYRVGALCSFLWNVALGFWEGGAGDHFGPERGEWLFLCLGRGVGSCL